MTSALGPAGPEVATTLLIPVKGLDQAKSRLGGAGGFDAETRRALALAFAVDTVSVALACPGVAEVLVVTGDEAVRRTMRDLAVPGAPALRTAADASGLNASLVAAGRAVRGAAPSQRLLALCADLPALRVEDLTALLVRQERRVVVADRHGVGTCALLASGPWRPRFGDGSMARHLADGAVALTDPVPTLRADVDTAADLAYARTLGLGPRSTAVEEDRRRPGPSGGSHGPGPVG